MPLPREYGRADVFVLPTLYEGYGMAVAEALARGLPVDQHRDRRDRGSRAGDAGIVVPPGDRAAFTAALSRVIGDPDLRARLTANAAAARDDCRPGTPRRAAMADVLDRESRRPEALRHS